MEANQFIFHLERLLVDGTLFICIIMRIFKIYDQMPRFEFFSHVVYY